MRKGTAEVYSSHHGLNRALQAYDAMGGDASALYQYTEYRRDKEPLICLRVPRRFGGSGRVRIHYQGYEDAVAAIHREIHRLAWPSA